MPVERSPFKRSSLPGVVRDSHRRVQALEAAQIMPYAVGSVFVSWDGNFPAGSVLPVEIGGLTTTDSSLIYGDPAAYGTLPFGGSCKTETTDESIFRFPQYGDLDPDSGVQKHGVEINGGGLFFFHCQVTVENDGEDPEDNVSTYLYMGNDLYDNFDPGFIVIEAAAREPFPAVDTQYGRPQHQIAFTGWISTTGFGFSSDPAYPGPPQPTYLKTILVKTNLAGTYYFTMSWMIARWSPYGFGIWSVIE